MDGKRVTQKARTLTLRASAPQRDTTGGRQSRATTGIVWTATAERVLALVGRKWTASILRDLHDGPLRFFQIRAGIGGIQPKVLRENLRALERSGFLERVLHDDGGGSTSIAYELTRLGDSLLDLLVTVHDWGSEHLDEVHDCRRGNGTTSRTG